MNNLEIELQSKNSTFTRIWNRIPVIIRAVIIGFLVSTVGVGSWMLIVTFVPGLWGLVLMMFVLGLYLKYFSGSWWPESTSRFRKTNFRSTHLSSSARKWGLISALLFVIVFQSGLMVTFRFIEYPADLFKAEYNFDAIPVSSAWIGLLMASLVAGICEETGFRGYMQVPLEKKYGPKVAITIVSVVFVFVHLYQAWAWPILGQIFAAAAFLGILAYRSGSLIPGIIAHAIMDIFNFSYWWSDVLGVFDKRPVSVSGFDGHFIFWSAVFLFSIPLFLWATLRAQKLQVETKTNLK